MIVCQLSKINPIFKCCYCRYGNVCLVGPKGCGKTSVIAYCAQYLSMDLISCSARDDADKTKSVFLEAFKSADKGQPKLILVPLTHGQTAIEILDFLGTHFFSCVLVQRHLIVVFADKVFYYYDIPAGFTRRDHMDRLFDTDEDRFSALLDPSKLDTANQEARYD